MNKASEGDGIPLELLFQILKDDAVKVLHSICQQNLEISAVATGLEKVSFHSNSQRKAMSKNAATIRQLHSSHTLVK